MKLGLSVDKIIMYMISISLLLGSSCMFFLAMPMASLDGLNNIQYIFLATFCLIGCFYQGKMQVSQKLILVCILLVIYLLIYLLITASNPMAYLTKHVLIFIIFFLYCSMLIQNKNIEKFAKAFVNVVSIVAAISLFFWLFGSVLGVIKGVFATYMWGGSRTTVNYHWLYFENHIQATEILGHPIIRNTGIYAEAPGFSSYLIVALAIAIPAENKQYPLKQKVLLVITMVTTLSTKGLIAVMILIALTYLFTHSTKSAAKFIQKSLFAFMLIAAATIGTFLLLEDKSTTGSYRIRMDDVQAALSTWKNHMLFGSGYNDSNEIIQNFSVSRSNNGLSMGLTLLLAQGGIYMVAFYVMSFILALYASRHLGRTLFIRILIFGFMIMFNLLISSAQYTAITIFIIACGYAFACTSPLKHESNEKAASTQ